MPRDVYQDMLLDASSSAPRDLKQVHNARYLKAKRSNPGTEYRKNSADQMQTLLNIFHGHSFMKEIIQTKAKNPSVICYMDENLWGINQFCSADAVHPSVLGVDRTFNIGPCFVTTVVHHHMNVIRKITQNHPIVLAAVYLHWDGTYETYHRFFSHVQSKLQGTIGGTQLNLVIGSDEEAALTKALKDCFPQSQQILCSRHLEENVRRYLSGKVGVDDKTQREVLRDIFGNNGLTAIASIEEFQLRASELHDMYTENLPSFIPYFVKVASKIKNSVVQPRKEHTWIPINWKNNSCESMNNILKLSANWKTLKLPELVDRLFKIVKVQQLDVRRAIYGYGNYELAPWMVKMYVRPAVWNQKTEEEKEAIYRKFVKGAPPKSKIVDCRRVVTVTENTKECKEAWSKEKD